MASEKDRDLRRLIKKFRITFKPPSHAELPSRHKNTFNQIRLIRGIRFNGYSAGDVIRNEEPWTAQTKRRAEWLSTRAATLFNQQRNEAGWRFDLENDVLHMFMVEVACPHCRARIWRSQIEAAIEANDTVTRDLQARRESRMSCTCPPEIRAGDTSYDLGMNPLFDNRAEEMVMYDPLVSQHDVPRRPDRVVGLKKTRAFANLLDASSSSDIRSTPFVESQDPLLFPFLVLEAKREKSSEGFEEIQTQTAFPIRELLSLQENIRVTSSQETHSTAPLVWFIASKGDNWRVYSCYTTDESPNSYEIVQLWSGSLMEKDDSLQLLLIIDYIADWARDVYRPGILRQLKSFTTGTPYDLASVSVESEILSRRGQIAHWIPAPPTVMETLEPLEDFDWVQAPIPHESVLAIPIPNTQRGSLQSASIFESRIFGLRLTEDNYEKILQFAGGLAREHDKSRRAARDIVNFISTWDELIAISEADLDYLEDSWAGDVHAEGRASTASRTVTFYVLIEYSTFITSTWETVKEISYVAVSKEALELLFKKAEFQKPPETLDSMHRKARPCSHQVWRATVECLRLGSPWQHFSAAVTCALLTLYSLPDRKRLDHSPPTEALGFGYLRRSQLRAFIDKIHKFGEAQRAPKSFLIPTRMNSLEKANLGIRFERFKRKRDIIPKPEDLTFRRVSRRKQVTSLQQEHTVQLCERCRHVSQKYEQDYTFCRDDESRISGYGMVLLETLDLTSTPYNNHDICLFVFDAASEIDNNFALAVVVEDLLQSSHMFHTIRHPLPRRFYSQRVVLGDTVWNLPPPYRSVTKKQRLDCYNWILELQGLTIPDPPEGAKEMDYWSNLQLLLHCMIHGSSYEDAYTKVSDVVKDKKPGWHRSSYYSEGKRILKGSDVPPELRWRVGSMPRSYTRGSRTALIRYEETLVLPW
ncbi:hypothetical protein NA57DRAFT_79416 [Rhizodiscina lignyota]|uniref:Uncharacterized protein n=1 Tax=Rhizodiscina lignyota TaxID=1504668 RepID=A0A9P4IB62_9PEZI|nr:hypothetical protein NA57DRAFT_79416 [Rhizodiscina lignyota]